VRDDFLQVALGVDHGLDGAHFGAGRLAVFLARLDHIRLRECHGDAAHQRAGRQGADHRHDHCLFQHESIPGYWSRAYLLQRFTSKRTARQGISCHDCV